MSVKSIETKQLRPTSKRPVEKQLLQFAEWKVLPAIGGQKKTIPITEQNLQDFLQEQDPKGTLDVGDRLSIINWSLYRSKVSGIIEMIKERAYQRTTRTSPWPGDPALAQSLAGIIEDAEQQVIEQKESEEQGSFTQTAHEPESPAIDANTTSSGIHPAVDRAVRSGRLFVIPKSAREDYERHASGIDDLE